MTPSGESATIAQLARNLLEHQASLQVDHPADHGWQVGLSNPGGSLFFHEREGADKWAVGDEGMLADTIAKAIARAESEGWW